ncbi:MAG: 2-amino-4-hydroxy-6-hydroxymethyldihydropteridine diphosphokinase [Phototrophicaceae bacterium]
MYNQLEVNVNTVYLSLGSNIDGEANLQRLIGLLGQGLHVLAVSSFYHSADANGGTARYINAAIIAQTPLDPVALKTTVLRPAEAVLGRVRPSPIITADADLVLFNRDVLTYLGKPIPDPSVLTAAYVARPLAEIAPDYVHPITGETLAQIAARLKG